ncbi:MAG: glycosyltransferase family 2 protein [Tepidisphaeraceae bacterium]
MSDRVPITFILLARDEEVNIPHALGSVVDWAEQVFVVDSGSTDRTREITESLGAAFVPHPWEGYARQKNWALDNLPIHTPWVFILDADESITKDLREALTRTAVADNCRENGFYINRRIIILGKWIRHCGYYPSWNIRFFRRGKARYAIRSVHEHMVVDGSVGYLDGEMMHDDRRGLYHFIEKHNWYSTLEAREAVRLDASEDYSQKVRLIGGGSVERRRWLKRYVWPWLPLRWLARFFSMYILKMGFMDGWVGFHFCVMLAIYEYQIFLKTNELRMEKQTLLKQARRAKKQAEDTQGGPNA